MRPVPVEFHLGPLAVHTYGIGLAVTFWFAYRYLARRLRAHGYQSEWLGTTFVWVIVASIAGARAVHVIANLSYYRQQPGQILQIWNGGLTSFGGLALGVPVGLWSARRRCPQLRSLVAADLVAPVLASAWAIGRLLGPQLMVAGGGKPTSAWFGMYYAGEVGKRLPVPVFQAIECFLIYLVALRVERAIARRGGPLGVVVALTASLWGLSRFFDEYVLLTHDVATDAVEIASLAFFGLGMLAVALLMRRARRGLPGSDPWGAPAPVDQAAGQAGDAPDATTAGPGGDVDGAPAPGRAGELVASATHRAGDVDTRRARNHRGASSAG